MRLLPFLLLLAACASPAPQETVDPALTTLLQPNDPDLPYPVYEEFDEIAELFTADDGRTYLINFWATWCQPCVEEIPYFERLAAETGEEVQIVMVSIDFARDVRGKLRKFVEERPLELPVVALIDGDYNSWIDRVDPEWGGAIPVTVIYRNGKREFHTDKFDSYEEVREAVAAVE